MTSPAFYGWRVVAAMFALTLVGFGSAYTFGAFVAPLEQTFGIGRGSVSAIFGVTGFLYFGLGAITGPLADRLGVRRLVGVGVALMGGGLVIASLATTATGVLAAYSLGIGLDIGCLYVPALGVIQRWFARRRGLASGLAVSGIGVGTLLMPPLAQWLIVGFGWRSAYLVLGLVTLVVGAVATLVIRQDPRDFGQSPDGDLAPAEEAPADGCSVREAVRSRGFWRLYAGTLMIGIGAFVPFVHLVPYAVEQGISDARATLLITGDRDRQHRRTFRPRRLG